MHVSIDKSTRESTIWTVWPQIIVPLTEWSWTSAFKLRVYLAFSQVTSSLRPVLLSSLYTSSINAKQPVYQPSLLKRSSNTHNLQFVIMITAKKAQRSCESNSTDIVLLAVLKHVYIRLCLKAIWKVFSKQLVSLLVHLEIVFPFGLFNTANSQKNYKRQVQF